MSVLLRSLLVLSVTSLFLVGCGEKEAPPVEATPAPVATPAEPVAPVEATPAASGGYEPSAEERIPGITLDAAAVDAAAVPAEAAPEVK